jgi:zeaxanthin glucosyltransferase
MKRVLVLTLPEKGHYHPLLGPALELERRGHEVAFAACFDICAELEAAGVRHVLVPPGALPPPSTVRGAALAAILRDPRALSGWIRELLVEAPARQVEGVRAMIRDFRPDAVAIDTMSYVGAIAASLERVPWVGWATSLNPVVPASMDSELLRTVRALDSERRQLFEGHAVAARFRVADVLSDRGTAVFATEALTESFDPTVTLVGPSLGGQRAGATVDWSFAEGRPLVYASFGSQAWHQPQRFDALIDACRRIDFALLVAAGDLAATYAAPGAPDWLRSVAVAPQLEALKHARVLVTHGGANSVMEALSQGVPMLVAPLCNDQPHNRWFVERAGAGIGLDLDACATAELAGALRRLAADGPERQAATRIAAGYATRAGASGAADLVLRSAA